MNYLRMGCFALLVFAVAITGTAAAASVDEIEQVEINVLQDNSVASEKMEHRVIASVQAVSEKLLVGRKAADVAANQKRFEDIIRQVFDRVLYGYELTDVRIVPGTKTLISLRILPWGEVVQSTSVQIDTGEFTPADQKLINQDLTGIERKIEQILIGLPVDAFSWADSVSRALIREAIAAQLPEFRADIDYVPAKHVTVNIKLQPVGPLIRKTEVRLQSKSIPKLLLLPINEPAENAVDEMNGLPVAFVQRHREEYIQRIQDAINRSNYVSKYHLNTELILDLREKAKAELIAETEKYKINLEGVLDLGRDGNGNTMFRSHVGYMQKHNDELFMDVNFFPNTISWRFQPGYGRQLADRMYVGIKHDLRNHEDIGILRYTLNNDLWLNLEHNLTTGYKLTGIRYQLHEYLAAEAISDQNKTWVRLIADL